ncbi:MAG: cysteine--tRNA ligase, partial [Desulfobacterales bacterium]
YLGTAEEIWRQTKGDITKFVATMGTSGTLMGVSRRFKDYNSDIQIIGVEPYLGHKIQGLKNMKEAYRPEIFEKMRLDQKVNVEDEEAYEMSRRLAREEGVFVGMSSGAAMVIAVREAEKMTAGTIVAILPDGGERYLSTPLFAVKEKVDLNFFNTLSRSKEPFEPVLPGKVSMYSCGPTAHASIHVGECRRFVFADLLSRYLEFRGYSVTHVMNITDLDDKTILGSEREGEEISRFTEKHIRGFKKDCETIGIKPADQYPRASQHVEDMVRVAKKLVQKGYAYEKLRSIYFNISRFAEYGRLSGIDIDKIKVGTTVDLDEYEKDNPRDFTLMKRAKLSELKRGIYIKTDWGNVRPSWHIQCAAMSMKYLGETYDIHTASRELVFPHHENKLAIAMSLTGKPLARYWLHCDRVLVQGKKVDEKGIAPTVSDLVQMGYTGREIRYWLLSTHYHKPVAYATERLDEARSALKRLDTCVDTLLRLTDGAPYHELDQLVYDVKQGFINAMDDDLNISAGMASIFKNVKKINLLLLEQNIDPHGASKIVDTLRGIDTVLGIFKFSAALSGSKIQKLIQKRETARAVKNWDLADKIRDQLQSSGVCVRDQKTSQGEGIQK